MLLVLQGIGFSALARNNIKVMPFSNFTYNYEKTFAEDMNGDGKCDVVLYNVLNGSLDVAINTGNYSNTTFATCNMNFTKLNWLTDPVLSLSNVKFVDVVGDGKLDAVIVQNSNSLNNIYVAQNNGSCFTLPVLWGTTPNAFSNFFVGNFNSSNSKADILFFDPNGNLLLGANTGNSFNLTNAGILSNSTGIINVGDFSGDGLLDIFTKSTSNLEVYVNNGTNFVFNGWDLSLITGSNSESFVEDFTDDGTQDILLLDKMNGKLIMVSNIGYNSFTSSVWYTSPYLPALSVSQAEVFRTPDITNNWKICIGDFSGDGKIDIFGGDFTSSTDHLWMGYNKGNEFVFNEWEATNTFYGNTNYDMQVGDYFVDGKPDILFSNQTSNQLSLGVNAPILEGYSWPLSAKPSEQIDFMISGNGLKEIQIERYTSGNISVQADLIATYNIDHKAQYTGNLAWRNGCNWESTFNLTIPNNWESGYYGIKLTSINDEVNYIPFIVKSGNTNKSCNGKGILYLANTNTWNAYNPWCGDEKDREVTYGSINNVNTLQNYSRSKYGPNVENPTNTFHNFSTFSYHRPWPCARPNPYLAPATEGMHQAMGQLLRAELWIFTWLKDYGYEPEVITDVDLHNYPTSTNSELNEYKTLIFGTHPEYWTEKMYDNVKLFQKEGRGTNGGNIISIGGNSIYEMVELNANNQMVCYGGNDNSDRDNYLFSPLNGGGAKRTTNIIGLTSGNQVARCQPFKPLIYNHFLFNSAPLCTIPFIASNNGPLTLAENSIGCLGINNGNDPLLTNTGAVGWETDYLDPLHPFGNDLELLATGAGVNYAQTADMIFVRNKSGLDHHGFIFSAGSIYFGGSMVVDPATDQLMHNVLSLNQTDIKASDLISNNGGNNIFQNQTFYIQQKLQIDQNIEFENCTFNFGWNAGVNINFLKEAKFSSCILQAACNTMWDGITVPFPSSKLVLDNNFKISDMMNGIQVQAGAQCTVKDNIFVDNKVSMQFSLTPVGGLNSASVTSNTFTSSGNFLLYPLNNLQKSEMGIKITNCNELRIGEMVNGSHNTFINLNTGIVLEPLFNTNGDIYLSNNDFININDDAVINPEDKINQLYTSAKGAGVYMTSISQHVHIESSNHEARFENCDKAVAGTNTSVDLREYEIKDCLVGLGINDANGKEFNIAKNKITNAMLGIQIRGDVHKVRIQDHYGVDGGITVLGGSLSSNLGHMGIDIGFYSSTHPGEVEIVNNQVNLLGNVGVGINALQAGFNTRIWNNKIYFNTAVVGGQSGLMTNDLTGIRSVFGLDNQIDENKVFGYDPNARGSTGIELVQNRNIAMACNQVNNSQLGIAAVGNCGTQNDKVVGNIMNNHVYGLMTMPYVLSQGNLNDIGILSTQDNYNQFLGSYLNSYNHKTYRWWSNSSFIQSNNIYTSLIYNSGSNYPSGAYTLFNTPNPYICDNGIGYDNGEGPIFGIASLEEAEDIIDGNMIFESYPDICQWVAEQNLYIDLDRDSITRNSSIEFIDFYSDHYSVAMGELFRVEQFINELNANFNSATLPTQIQLINTMNDGIVTAEQHEIYLKDMNSILLKVLEGGRDSLNNVETNKIHDLAHSCPAQNGLAVFKARQLNSIYEPLMTYNDYALCAPANKGGKGLYDDLISFLNGTVNMNSISEEDKLTQQQVTLYPVPSTDVINIKFTIPNNKEVVLYIYDCTGKMLMQKTINEDQLNTIDISYLVNGLYTYRISNDLENFTGKFNIIR